METSIQALQHAANVYRLLSHYYLNEPSVDDLRQLSSGAQGRALSELGCHLMDDIEDLTLEDREEALAIEYCRLFIGPGPHLSPHESVLRGEGRHWGESTMAVNSHYAENGFQLHHAIREMPDHIGIELEYVATLIEQEIDALSNGDHARADRARGARETFLGAHLCQWVPTFARQLKERASLSFYTQLATLTQCWVSLEAGALQTKNLTV